MKEQINGKTFIAISDFNAIKNPVSKTDYSLYIDKGTEWKAELTLLRKKDLKTEDIDETNDEETLFAVLLSNEKDKVIFDLENSRWNFENVLLSKNDFEKQKNTNATKNKSEENALIKKYGEKFGKLVFQKKLEIGMSKEMCSDVCGITLNKKMIKNANGEIEVWEYTGILKLYFKNGKLSEIVKY
jgi:predicted secreted acid phosphatase